MSDHWYTSIDPTVTGAIRGRDHDWEAFRRRVRAARARYGVGFAHARNPFTGDLDCVGVLGRSDRLPGRWTTPDRNNRSRPYTANLEGRALLDSLGFPWHPTPGLPDAASIQSFDGIVTRWTRPFLDPDGRAWALIPDGRPTGRKNADGRVWTECEEWEYVRARNETESAGTTASGEPEYGRPAGSPDPHDPITVKEDPH